MATVLENIFVDGVRKEDSIDSTRPDAIIDVTTFDGLTANVRVMKSGEHTYALFSFAAETDRTAGADGADEGDGDNEAEEEEVEVTPDQEAETLNKLVQGWAYQLSTSKAELFNQSLSDLIRDPETEAAEDAE